MRLFLAIRLSEEMREALTSLQEDMRAAGVKGNYTKPENLHLTIAFIGEYPDPDYVKEIAETVPVFPFSLTLSGVGSFRQLFWAGADGGDALPRLVSRVRRALAEADIPFDRKKFKSHITLVRKPSVSPDTWWDVRPVSMTVDQVTLYRSDRGKNGMIYTEL